MKNPAGPQTGGEPTIRFFYMDTPPPPPGATIKDWPEVEIASHEVQALGKGTAAALGKAGNPTWISPVSTIEQKL